MQIFLLSARPYNMPNEEKPDEPNNTGVSIRFLSQIAKDEAVNGITPLKGSLPLDFEKQLMTAQLPALCDVDLELKAAAGGKAGVSFSNIKIIRSINYPALISAILNAPKPA